MVESDIAASAGEDANVYVAWVNYEGDDPPEDSGTLKFARSKDVEPIWIFAIAPPTP